MGRARMPVAWPRGLTYASTGLEARFFHHRQETSRSRAIEGRTVRLAGGIGQWYQSARQAAQLCRFYRGFLASPSYPLGSANQYNQ